MSRRGNWDRLRMRDRMRRYGTTDAREEVQAFDALLRRSGSGARPTARPAPARPKLSKEQLRTQAALAFIAWREQHEAGH